MAPRDEDVTVPAIPELRPGRPLAAAGRYEIVEEIGSGGMGRVYLARRCDGEYRQRVAVKVLRWSRGTDEAARRRFRIERQILADLDHPNIARLLDGGTTGEGLPFLVMEHVEGVSILDYCATHDVPIGTRLDLVRRVSAAVDYAHRRLVVHRDIKPGNILVTSSGEPKLLDFGIAKLLDPGAYEEAGAPTVEGTHPMTLRYASPEQVRGEALTVATDVYSLGVVLYELLTGRPPYRPEGPSPLGWVRAICDEEPPRPSTAAASPPSPESSPVEGGSRRLRGDLDAIVLKALRKDPAERYPSAGALADDLERYRSGLPVTARRPTLRYRARKFARRNPLGLVAAAVILALAVGWTASLAIQLESTARERDRATRERVRSEQVVDFLVELFEIADPDEAKGNEIRAREILDRGAARVSKELRGQPDVQATMKETMGAVYQNLGLYPEARSLLEEAVGLRRREGATEDLAASLGRLSGVMLDMAEYDEADALIAEALGIYERLGWAESIEVAELENDLGVLRDIQGEGDEAVRLYRKALALHRRLGGPASARVGTVLIHLAISLHGRGEYEEAEVLCREALAIHRRLREGDHSDIAQALGNLASILHAQGEYDEAEALYRESLAMRRRLLGDAHPSVGLMANNLGSLMLWRGDLDGAEPLFEEALEIIRAAHGERHRLTSFPHFNLGQLLLLRDDPARAEPHLRRSLEISSGLFDENHREVALSRSGLGAALCRLGELEEGERLVRSGLAVLEAQAVDEWRRAQSLSWLGSCLASAGEHDAAIEALGRALPVLRAKFGDGHPLVVGTRDLLAALEASG